jgi:hypothetical protein
VINKGTLKKEPGFIIHGVKISGNIFSGKEMEFLDINLKRIESLAPCFSQSLLLAEFKGNHTLLWF